MWVHREWQNLEDLDCRSASAAGWAQLRPWTCQSVFCPPLSRSARAGRDVFSKEGGMGFPSASVLLLPAKVGKMIVIAVANIR